MTPPASVTAIVLPAPAATAWSPVFRHRETAWLLGLLAVVNVPLLFGRPLLAGVFRPDDVLAGEWWRLVLHPFVHVSLYHLLLDAGAALLLYDGLRGHRAGHRLLLAASSGAGALLAAWIGSPEVHTAGLCGLSGLAHGLMAVTAVETLGAADRGERRVGAITLALVVAKTLFEALTGNVLFASWHLGDVGVPLAACHAGGVMGGLTAAWIGLRLPPRAAQRHPIGMPERGRGVSAATPPEPQRIAAAP